VLDSTGMMYYYSHKVEGCVWRGGGGLYCPHKVVCEGAGLCMAHGSVRLF